MPNPITEAALVSRIKELVRVLNSEIDTASNEFGLKVDVDVVSFRDISDPYETPVLFIDVLRPV